MPHRLPLRTHPAPAPSPAAQEAPIFDQQPPSRALHRRRDGHQFHQRRGQQRQAHRRPREGDEAQPPGPHADRYRGEQGRRQARRAGRPDFSVWHGRSKHGKLDLAVIQISVEAASSAWHSHMPPGGRQLSQRLGFQGLRDRLELPGGLTSPKETTLLCSTGTPSAATGSGVPRLILPPQRPQQPQPPQQLSLSRIMSGNIISTKFATWPLGRF